MMDAHGRMMNSERRACLLHTRMFRGQRCLLSSELLVIKTAIAAVGIRLVVSVNLYLCHEEIALEERESPGR